MSIEIERLKAEAATLSARDSAEVASFLLNSQDSQADEGAEADWGDELDRRADEIQRGAVTGTPAEDVFVRIRSRHP